MCKSAEGVVKGESPLGQAFLVFLGNGCGCVVYFSCLRDQSFSFLLGIFLPLLLRLGCR